jgi:hypothetical protein
MVSVHISGYTDPAAALQRNPSSANLSASRKKLTGKMTPTEPRTFFHDVKMQKLYG